MFNLSCNFVINVLGVILLCGLDYWRNIISKETNSWKNVVQSPLLPYETISLSLLLFYPPRRQNVDVKPSKIPLMLHELLEMSSIRTYEYVGKISNHQPPPPLNHIPKLIFCSLCLASSLVRDLGCLLRHKER